MTSHSLVSVITPCFNCSAHILRCIQSVLAQTYDNFELIIINDGSTDNTDFLLSQISDARIKVLHQPNGGVSSARNLGLSSATGQYVAFLDADDEWRPCFLEKMVSALEDNTDNKAMVYCGWQNIGLSGGRGLPYIPPNYEHEDKWIRLLTSCPWPIHAALCYKEPVLELGGFDTRYTIGEDYLLWLKIAYSHRLIKVTDVLAFYHHHGGEQATNNKVQAALQTWHIQQDFLAHHPELTVPHSHEKLSFLIDSELYKRAYECYCQRDFEASHAIFRHFHKSCSLKAGHMKHYLPSLLPLKLYIRLMRWLDSQSIKRLLID